MTYLRLAVSLKRWLRGKGREPLLQSRSYAPLLSNIIEDNQEVDVIGADYRPDAETARMGAVRFAADLLKAEPERVWRSAELRVEAKDT